MINSPVVTTEIYFSLGQDSSKFFKNMLQQIVFSPLFSEMKQHRLQCFIYYVMDDGVFARWVNLSTSSNRFVKKLISIKFYCKLLLIGPGPKQV